MSVKVVNSGGGTVNVKVETTPTISVSTPDVKVVDVNPVYTSGQPGPTGPAGPAGAAGAAGQGVPTGGSADQVLIKSSGDDYDTEWGSVDYSDVTNTPNLSDVAESGDYDDLSNTPSLATVAESGDYGDLTGTPTIVNNVDTNLSFTRDATSVTVVSSDGNDAVLPQSSTTQAGVMSAASHQKLANLNASADVTNSSSVEAAGAIMDSDFTSNGLMERTGDGSYDVVAKSTDNISEGSNNLYYTDARADARVSAVIDTDNTLADPSDTVVPSQAAIKTYVDNQLGTQNLSLGTVTGTAVSVNISGGGTSVTIPAANTTEAGLMTEAQFDKLADIEENADVTDATSVAAAGAVMNSGNESIDGVKTFTSTISGSINGNAATVTNGVYTTSSVTALSDVSDAGSGIIMSTAERTKLTGIEANATADQTDAEIRAAVEAATDSNVFTDADHSKLNGIEANATADQTDAEIRAAVEAATDSNVFTDADHTKLDNIAANATNYGDSDVNAHLSGGTGIGYNNGTIDVDVHTTIETAQSGDDATITVQGPSGVSDEIRLVAGSNVTLTETGDQITIATTSGTMDNVVDDTSPQLGGALDTNDYSIVSASDRNVTIAPHGAGEINLNKTVNVSGDLTLRDDDELLIGDGGETIIKYTSDSNRTEFKSDLILFTGNTNTAKLLDMTGGGGVGLYHNGSRKLTTLTGGIGVTGNVSKTSGYITDFSVGATNAGDHLGAEIVKTVYSGSAAGLTAGKIYYMGETAWTEAHADSEADASGFLGIATSANQNGEFVTRGYVRVDDIKGTTPTKGDIVYLSDVDSGYPTVDRPDTDGDIVRILGYVFNDGSNIIYFNPSPDFIEVA